MRIGVVAPSSRFSEDAAERTTSLAARLHPGATLVFHPQCFMNHNHFAGTDYAREDAFVEVANDPGFDALWFARGGYGACRIAEAALARLGPRARDKAYLGYSDAGFLLAGLYRAGFERVAHGPMPQDVLREGGKAAIGRALGWLVEGDPGALDPAIEPGAPHAAFNLTVLGHMIGTPLQPDLAGHVVMIEEVSEHMYRTDRAMFHITSDPGIRRAVGIRLGRCSDVQPNDPDFGETEEEVVQHWCARAGLPYLGRCDIGHDAGNKVVPFG
jgi:muramoyltetrapeptide carboxypeptidase